MIASVCGIVAPIADQQAKACAGEAWCEAVGGISPRIAFVRGSIGADHQGNVDVGLLKRGLQAYADVRLPVHAVLELNLGPLASHNPNDHLGYHGDMFKNPFIDAYTNVVIKLLNELGDLCPAVVWLGNEFNVQAALNPTGSGKVIPQLALGDLADPSKPEALSPEAAWSLTYHASYWIAKECPQVLTIYPAALSYDLAFKTSQYDDWIGGFIDTGFAYLARHGAKAPWPFTGLSLNTEGIMDTAYAAYIRSGMAQHKQDHGIGGPTVIGEWGVPAAGLDVGAMTTTARLLSGICEEMSFFAAHQSGGYGIFALTFAGGLFVPGAPTEWLAALPGMLEAV